MAISPNPGFLLILAAALALILPARARGPVLLAAALAAIWATFAPPFGEAAGLRQIGLSLSPLKLDATSQLYGFTALLVAALLAIAAFSRRDRLEDVCLMLHAGGAASAAFSGDLVTFVAGSCLSALGACGLTLATGATDARNAGVRLLTWHALSALALTAGAALAWESFGAVRLERMALASPAGALLFGGLLIQAGAPLAHVWLRDGVSHGGMLGAAAIAALAPLAAFVGLARLFPGEAALVPIGVILALAPLPLALAEPDWRRSAAYGVISQNGFVLAALGVATPLALAGAGASAFAHAVQALGMLLALGAARAMVGADFATGAGSGLAARAPTLAALTLLLAASFGATPGTAGYAARSLLLEAFALGDHAIAWTLLTAATAGAVAHAALKTPLAALFGPRPAPLGAEAPFPTLLAAGLAAFFVVAIGVSPRWLYDLAPPGEVFHDPYELRLAATHVLLMATAAGLFLLLVRSPLFPAQRPAEILEVDWLWRRPGRALARQLGARLTGLYAAYGAGQARAAALVGEALRRIAAYVDGAASARGGLGGEFALLAAAAAVAWALMR